MKHTKGPWICYDMGNGIRVTPASVQDDLLPHVSANFNEIALLKPDAGQNTWSDEVWQIQKANAYLIAAAPDLLACLLRVVSHGIDDIEIFNSCMDAINKANGKGNP